MSDVFTEAKRSEVMSRIRGRGNKDTELALARVLRANGITGWRRQVEIRGRARSPLRAGSGAHGVTRPTFRVKPDFVFRQVRLALFVDGCFWHGCPKHATQPKNNRAFWRRKLAGNQVRDALVTRTLRRAGWRVLRVWEHELEKIKLRSAPHPKPPPPAPLHSPGTPHPAAPPSPHPMRRRKSDGRGWRPALPVRGRAGGRNEARLLRRIQRALNR